jgi:hypothetical protein
VLFVILGLVKFHEGGGEGIDPKPHKRSGTDSPELDEGQGLHWVHSLLPPLDRRRKKQPAMNLAGEFGLNLDFPPRIPQVPFVPMGRVCISFLSGGQMSLLGLFDDQRRNVLAGN